MQLKVVLATMVLMSQFMFPIQVNAATQDAGSGSLASCLAGSNSSGASGGSSNTSSGSSGGTGTGSSSGGLGGLLSDLTGGLSGLLQPINTWITQAGCYRESVVNNIGDQLGGLLEIRNQAGQVVGSVRESIDDVVGAIGLLDPDKFLRDVLGNLSGDDSSPDELPVTQVNPVVLTENVRVLGNVTNARSDSQTVLSEEGQESMQSQLTALGEQVQGGAERANDANESATASMELYTCGSSSGTPDDTSGTDEGDSDSSGSSGDSSSGGSSGSSASGSSSSSGSSGGSSGGSSSGSSGGSSSSSGGSSDSSGSSASGGTNTITTPECSQAASQQSVQLATQAQSRVSTQDAIKDLNAISSNISVQMSQLSNQSAIQSQQLSGLSAQNAIGLQLDAAQLGRLNQVVTGVAVTNQTLADINERDQGDRQAQFIREASETSRLNHLNSTNYRLAP